MNKHKRHIVDRINRSNMHCHCMDFVQWNKTVGTQIDKILCRGCGTTIKSLIESEDPISQRSINGQTIIVKQALLAECSNYVEIEVSFDDGSKHVMNVCRTCANTMDEGDLETFYLADLKDWLEQDVEGLEHAAYRRPISFRKVREDGRAL